MGVPYILYLITFLGYPILAYIASVYINVEWLKKKFLKWVGLFVTIHIGLFLIGLSIKGDNPDYYIFSFEYFIFCLITSVCQKSKHEIINTIGITGTVIKVLGFVQALPGILLFIVAAQDYEADKMYNFSSEQKTYQTRRYSYGFVTLDDTTYTFETYRTFNYLPFEYLVDKTIFSSSKSKLDFYDENFKIKIITPYKKPTLEFSSKNGEKFLKEIP